MKTHKLTNLALMFPLLAAPPKTQRACCAAAPQRLRAASAKGPGLLLLLAALGWLVAMPARAATITNLWTGASGSDYNWSTAGNWSNGVPTAATEVFFRTNAAVSSEPTPVNNTVDASTPVSSLNYIQVKNLFHNTLIADGVTLTVSNATSTTNVLIVGANTNASALSTPTVTTISGPGDGGSGGALVVVATNGYINVRNGGNNTPVSPATLDMSQLGNFTAYVNRFLCAGDGSTTLGSGITGNYFVDRAAGIVYLAMTNQLVFGSTTTWGVAISNPSGSVDAAAGSSFYLGWTNGIFTDYGIVCGGTRSGTSLLTFNPAHPGSTAYFRSRSGGAQGNWWIGNASSQNAKGGVNATADFSQGTLDAMVNQIIVGESYNNAATPAGVTGTLLLGAGVLNVNSLLIGIDYVNYCPWATGTVTVDGTYGSSQLIVNNGITLGTFKLYASTNGLGSAILNIQNGGSATVYGKILTTFADPANSDSEIHVTGGSSLSAQGIGPLQTFQLWQSTLTLNLVATPTLSAPTCAATNLDTLGPVTLNVLGGGLTIGQFPLIKYQTMLNDGFNAFTTLNLPLGFNGYLSNNTANSSIDLVITSQSFLYWSGAVNGLWDIATTANWLTNGTPAIYRQPSVPGDLTVFDDTATGTTTVLLTTNLSPGSITVSNASKDYTFNGTGQLSGPASLTKSGTGTLTLANTGTNNFTGGVNINNGTVTLSGPDNQLPTSAAVTLASGATLNLNNVNQTLASVSGVGGLALGSGNLSLGSSCTYGGVISGSGMVIQLHSGTQLTLSGANLYSGGTLINAATLFAANTSGSATGTGNISIGAGGVLQIGLTNASGSVAAGVITNNGTILFIRTDTTTCTSLITGTGGLDFFGPGYTGGTVIFNTPNTYSGLTWIVNGALRISAPNATSEFLVANGLYDGRLELAGGITITNPIGLGPKDQSLGGNTPNIVNVSGTNTITGVFQGVNGGKDWVIRSDAGQLTISSPFANGATSAATYNLWLRGVASGQFNSLLGSPTTGLYTALYKADSGVWTITGTGSTYKGSTYILGGTLWVNGSLASSTNVSVGAGATLGGTGYIAGPVTVSNTAVLWPGGMSIGTLTISNTLTLLDGSTNFFQLSASNGNGSNAQVQGITTLNCGGTLQATLAGALMGGEVFKLFSANAYSGAFSAFNLPALPPALSWDTSQLTVDGTLRVLGGIRVGQIVSVAQGPGGSFQIQISGTGSTNQPYRVLATTNIAEPTTNWVKVGFGTFTGGVFTFTDPNATNYPARFYRLVTP